MCVIRERLLAALVLYLKARGLAGIVVTLTPHGKSDADVWELPSLADVTRVETGA